MFDETYDSPIPAPIATVGVLLLLACYGAIFVLLIPWLDRLTVVLLYGWDAYSDGLRIVQSKVGVLSDGSKISTRGELLRAGMFIAVFLSIGIATMVVCERASKRIEVWYALRSVDE